MLRHSAPPMATRSLPERVRRTGGGRVRVGTVCYEGQPDTCGKPAQRSERERAPLCVRRQAVCVRGQALEQRVDVRRDLGGREVAAEALDRLAVGADQELLEVPRDVRAAHGRPERDGRAAEAAARQDERVNVVAPVVLGVAEGARRDHHRRLEVLEERQRARAVHVALGEDRDGGVDLKVVARADVLEGVEELSVALVGLVTKLVAREAKDGNLVPVLLGKTIHRSHVCHRRAS
mmetsp:Transcript_22800/g.61116  ORF Transcript_22800/g.61116 Transcript_22800/m.61116 type:complete len:235 (+) Transcript_22800:239-943(+)